MLGAEAFSPLYASLGHGLVAGRRCCSLRGMGSVTIVVALACDGSFPWAGYHKSHCVQRTYLAVAICAGGGI